MVSWCHLPGPTPSGAVARGPGRARAAQYRSKCNALPRGGSVGTPTYIPQNDPHDALIILNIHKWGTKDFQKKLPISSAHQPRSDEEVRSRVKNIFCVFQTFLNSPQNSEYFEHRHIGWGKKNTVSGRAKKILAPSAPTLSPKISNSKKTGSKTLGGSGGGGGVWNWSRPPPLFFTTQLHCRAVGSGDPSVHYLIEGGSGQ